MNAFVCQDLDGDNCDDCAILGEPNINNDGDDFESDGLCDVGDPDDDNDGLLDTEEDVNSNGLFDVGETNAKDSDTDDDGDLDGADNCPLVQNADQTDTDSDT